MEKRIRLFFIIFCGLLFGLTGLASTMSLEELTERARFEQLVNPGLDVSPEAQRNHLGTVTLLDIPHFEIPKRLLVSHAIKQADPGIRNSLEFTKNGETWVRWIPSYRDTQYINGLKEFLKKHGLSTEPQYHFKGYETASRSLFIFDPATKAIFSTKSPTNMSLGVWNDKPYPVHKAIRTLMVSEYFLNIKSRFPRAFANINLQPDTQMYGIEQLDQAMTIRELSSRGKNKRLIPLYSFFETKFGREFAKANSSPENTMDPLESEIKLVLKPWAFQLGRFIGLTGIASNSQHGQNSLIEVDEHLRPTGYVEFRDAADARVNLEILLAHDQQKLAAYWDNLRLSPESAEGYEVKSKTIEINLAPHHSLALPVWLHQNKIEPVLREINPDMSFLSAADRDWSENERINLRLKLIDAVLAAPLANGLQDVLGEGSITYSKKALPSYGVHERFENKKSHFSASSVFEFGLNLDPANIRHAFKTRRENSFVVNSGLRCSRIFSGH
jgi:hypothetical protein